VAVPDCLKRGDKKLEGEREWKMGAGRKENLLHGMGLLKGGEFLGRLDLNGRFGSEEKKRRETQGLGSAAGSEIIFQPPCSLRENGSRGIVVIKARKLG